MQFSACPFISDTVHYFISWCESCYKINVLLLKILHALYFFFNLVQSSCIWRWCSSWHLDGTQIYKTSKHPEMVCKNTKTFPDVCVPITECLSNCSTAIMRSCIEHCLRGNMFSVKWHRCNLGTATCWNHLRFSSSVLPRMETVT